MFAKKDALTQSSSKQFDLIIGQHTTIDGQINSEGSVRIDGIVKGNITCTGDVFIGTAAKVSGDVDGQNVDISGEVAGNVTAKGALSIYESGQLFGDINVASFAIEAGGVFEGMCHINTRGITSPKDKDLDTPTEKNERRDHKNLKSIK